MAKTQLSINWLTEGFVDFEYKKYTLLAYLQYIKSQFDKRKLYPMLSDLIFHYKNLLQLKENQQFLATNFPKKLTKADLEQLKLTYTSILQDDTQANLLMKELDEIIEFALPKMNTTLEEGKQIYDRIDQSLEIAPIGITPIYFREGYLFLCVYSQNDVQIYRYQMSLFERADETLRGIHFSLVDTLSKNRFETYESIKLNLAKTDKSLPNPATFLMHAQILCSLESSLLPIAKRRLMSYLTLLEKNK